MKWFCQEGNSWAVVPAREQATLFNTLAYATARYAKHIDKSMQIVKLLASRCGECVPKSPQVHWNGTKPYNKHNEVEQYEEVRKRQPPVFQIQVLRTSPNVDEMKDFEVRFVFNSLRLAHKAHGQLPKENKALLVAKASITTMTRTQNNHVYRPALKLKSLAQSLSPLPQAQGDNNDDYNPFQSSGNKLLDHQKSTVAWMLKHERTPEPFVEREIEEEVVEEIHLRLLGYATRMVVRRGGIIADDIGFGKTVMMLAIFQLQAEFDQYHYELRKNKPNSKIKALNCNMVICPRHIVRQWGEEANKFLGYRNGREFVLIEEWSDLRKSKPENHKLLIVSDSIFNEKNYMSALAYSVGHELPANRLTAKAFTEWKVGRGYKHWQASSAKKINRRKTKEKVYLLEQYSFNRIVWDEVSYENPAVASFVTNCPAVSKWLLSGTPPTRDLKDVCSMATSLGLHIARPIDLRPGLPRIANGPLLSPRTQMEEFESYGITKSSEFISERHRQAERFLAAFTACNKIDRGSHKFDVVEQVLVCPPTLAEASAYVRFQGEVRIADMDADGLKPDGIKRMKHALGYLKEPLDGEQLAFKALLHAATFPSRVQMVFSSEDSANSEASYHQRVLSDQETLLKEARQYVRYVFKKLIWLAPRLYRTIHEGRTAENQDVKDKKEYDEMTANLSECLRALNNRTLKAFQGRDNYAELAKAILPADGNDIDACIRDNKDLFGLDAIKGAKDSLLGSFSTGDDNINLMYKSHNSRWDEFYLLDPQDATNTQKLPNDDVLNLLLGIKGYTVESMEATSKTGPDRNALRAALKAHIEESLEERRISQETHEAAYERKHPGEDSGGLKELKKDDVVAILRREGLKVGAAKKKAEAIEILESHKKMSSGLGAYTTPSLSGCHAATRLPFLKGTLRIRGATKTQTNDEYCATWAAFTSACRNLYQQLAQMRCAEVFRNLESGAPVACSEDGCNSTESLALISQCGHVLCGAHRECKEYCGDGTNECVARWDNGIVELSRFLRLRDRQIIDDHLVPSNGNGTATAQSLDSKLKYVINLIRAIPENERVVLFAQHQSILEKAMEALKNEGIKCATTHNNATSSNPVEDFKKGKYKVLVMKINSAEAAGGNLTMANRVIFLTPVIGNSQHLYDSHMNQASGRCIRYGQNAERVHIYHCVMEGTIEVDVLGLRQRQKVEVEPGKALGKLVPRSSTGLEQVGSSLSSHEVWKGLNELDLSLALGFEDTRVDASGACVQQDDSENSPQHDTNDVATCHTLDQFADLPEDDRGQVRTQYDGLRTKYMWPKEDGQDYYDGDDSDDDDDSSDSDDDEPGGSDDDTSRQPPRTDDDKPNGGNNSNKPPVRKAQSGPSDDDDPRSGNDTGNPPVNKTMPTSKAQPKTQRGHEIKTPKQTGEDDLVIIHSQPVEDKSGKGNEERDRYHRGPTVAKWVGKKGFVDDRKPKSRKEHEDSVNSKSAAGLKRAKTFDAKDNDADQDESPTSKRACLRIRKRRVSYKEADVDDSNQKLGSGEGPSDEDYDPGAGEDSDPDEEVHASSNEVRYLGNEVRYLGNEDQGYAGSRVVDDPDLDIYGVSDREEKLDEKMSRKKKKSFGQQ